MAAPSAAPLPASAFPSLCRLKLHYLRVYTTTPIGIYLFEGSIFLFFFLLLLIICGFDLAYWICLSKFLSVCSLFMFVRPSVWVWVWFWFVFCRNTFSGKLHLRLAAARCHLHLAAAHCRLHPPIHLACCCTINMAIYPRYEILLFSAPFFPIFFTIHSFLIYNKDAFRFWSNTLRLN